MAPLAWILVRGTDRRALLTTALENGFTDIVFEGPPAREETALGRFAPIVRTGADLRRGGEPVGRYEAIGSGGDQDRVERLLGKVPILVVSARDWKVIPFENLIASAQPSTTRLLAEVETADEARLMLEALEVGTHGVVLAPRDPSEIRRLRAYLDARVAERVSLVPATVTGVRAIGSGDRVCVDTCSLLRPGEGLLVGSQSQGLFLVHGENLPSEYVAPRPFRVNAGSVHAYVLTPGGRTRYLSELSAGDEVLVVSPDGDTRTAVVGRCKVETRPLLLVSAETPDGRSFSTIVQNAETIRLVTPKGPRSVVGIAAGDEVLMRAEDVARHFGRPVKERIAER
ncbi:MAG: 3-dehydroquinate synthase II [Methanobacteriota archaeon]